MAIPCDPLTDGFRLASPEQGRGFTTGDLSAFTAAVLHARPPGEVRMLGDLPDQFEYLAASNRFIRRLDGRRIWKLHPSVELIRTHDMPLAPEGYLGVAHRDSRWCYTADSHLWHCMNSPAWLEVIEFGRLSRAEQRVADPAVRRRVAAFPEITSQLRLLKIRRAVEGALAGWIPERMPHYALRAAMRPEVTLACLLGIPVLHQDGGLRFFRRMAPEDQIAAIDAAVDGEDA